MCPHCLCSFPVVGCAGCFRFVLSRNILVTLFKDKYISAQRGGGGARGVRNLMNEVRFGLVYWSLTPQQQPGSYQGGEMMMKSVFWWRKPEYPEETTDLRQATDETFHTYGLCPVRGLNLGRSGVKQSELRSDEDGALAKSETN